MFLQDFTVVSRLVVAALVRMDHEFLGLSLAITECLLGYRLHHQESFHPVVEPPSDNAGCRDQSRLWPSCFWTGPIVNLGDVSAAPKGAPSVGEAFSEGVE